MKILAKPRINDQLIQNTALYWCNPVQILIRQDVIRQKPSQEGTAASTAASQSFVEIGQTLNFISTCTLFIYDS